ncbi:MAG TPA: hypothetical protein VLX68_07535 [Chitinivibrionales bacterium]|nr:hypothetical protein [Chitinivibrionales bacterium]
MFKRLVLCGICAALLSSADAATTRFQGYNFESRVIANDYGSFPEVRKNGRPWLQVQPGSEYSIVINNPLPVRVAVAVTIDGLNTIDGKRTTPEKAQKWMIDANSSLTLRGWQTDRGSLRRFIFTDQGNSYADWKGSRDNKNYIRNLGVIGVAYFWNRAELDAVLRPPTPFAQREEECKKDKFLAGAPSAARSAAADESRQEKSSRAGTGMGNRENNNVVDVEFHYDAGMYHTADVLTIYYEFAQVPPRPLPFIDGGSDDFAPEM